MGDTVGAMSNHFRELLAAYAHDAWSGWMRYLFAKCERSLQQQVVIPDWAVERWTRQMTTPYADLPEEEKQSDRKEADQMLALMGLDFDDVDSGLTTEERAVMDHLAAAWDAFTQFEDAISHDDQQDFAEGLHRIQQVFQGRAIRRLYPDYWR